MITEAKFKYALKDLMHNNELEDINVTLLCKKCGCHRQTFYYHYQDIYDLIASILLNEDLTTFSNQTDLRKALNTFLAYVEDNLEFLEKSYNSAARDLVDDFIYETVYKKILKIIADNDKAVMKKPQIRTVCRRFAKILSNEYCACFKENYHVYDKFHKRMLKFNDCLIKIILPSLIETSKKEDFSIL
ncbi:MAG: hypothetical protein SPL02_02230 [Bacilli bacterium]|nr:hypothetical protein [Bacilli bacterium]MDY6430449.1 hypothetical protein [Bacilli bacterium]